ncbi:S-phase kinase-associated protein 2-like [Littorina saxatilis]|uniref:S-phase kinase-associated protein 2-like n=1 Tax=Littorina saxatilis TaxID=31220 RepID=UPI0038B4F181
MAQNMKMGKIKGSRRLSKETRKENLPYYGNRRTSTGHPTASTSHQLSESMADSFLDDSSMAMSSFSTDAASAMSASFRQSRGPWNLNSLCEENGITPLPTEDEPDGHALFSTAPTVVAPVVGPQIARSSSFSVYTTLSSSTISITTNSTTTQLPHVTPSLQRRESPVLDVPLAPRVLVNSQRENCPRNHAQSETDPSSIFFGMLTPPRKDDLRPNHHFVTGPDYFEHISEEVILHIFSFLTRPSLARCMRVCKKWHRVGSDESLWRRVDLAQKTVKPRSLGQLVRRGTTHLRLAKAEMKGRRIKDIYGRPEEGPRMSRLQYLDLSMASINKEMLADIFAHCKQLRKVSLENVPVNDTVFHLLSENTHLDTLNLVMCQGVTASGLMPLFAHCRMLTQLNLAWTGMDRSCVAYVCGAVPPSMRLLNLSGCREAISDEDVETLCTRCPHLYELDLSDSLRLTDLSIDIIRQNLRELRRLSLSRCYSILPSSIAMLRSIPRLSSLNIIGMLSKEPIEELQEILPKILLNKIPFSTIARPTCGPRRTSIWEQRVRETL